VVCHEIAHHFCTDEGTLRKIESRKRRPTKRSRG
jgi:predicted Zn-dependent protease with MMP-like domain